MIRAGQYLSRETMIERLTDSFYCGQWDKSWLYAEKRTIAYNVKLQEKDEQEIGEFYKREMEEGL